MIEYVILAHSEQVDGGAFLQLEASDIDEISDDTYLKAGKWLVNMVGGFNHEANNKGINLADHEITVQIVALPPYKIAELQKAADSEEVENLLRDMDGDGT